MRVYWVERVDFWVAAALLRRQASHRRAARLICYAPPEANSPYRRLLRLAGISDIQRMARALGDMTDTRGINLYWWNDELMLKATTESLAGIDAEGLSKLTGIEPTMLSVFLTRATLADLHQQTLRATTLFGNAAFVDSTDQHLLVPASIFSPTLTSAYRRPNLSVARYFRPGSLWKTVREPLALLKSLLRSGKKAASNPARPSVAVQYVSGLDRSRINDIPWFPESGLQADDMLIYAEGSRTAAAASDARKHGFRFADLGVWQPGAQTQYRQQLLTAVRTWLSILVHLGIGKWARRAWLSRWLLAFLRSEARWRAFFIEHDVRVHLHVGDADALSLATVSALGKNKGIDFAFQLGGSCIELAFEYRALPDRVLFAWGDFHRRMNIAAGRKVPGKEPAAIVVSGHPHDYLADLHRSKAEALRAQIKARGVKHVIAGFDNVVRDDFLISPAHMVEFHTALTELASNPEIAVVVKPKLGSGLTLPGPVLKRQDELRAEGRWIELPPDTSVFEGALCADLVVALHMNTAAMEAAIARVPHVYYDLTAWGDHPFYRLRDMLIATNRDELRRLVTERLTGRDGAANAALAEYGRDLSPFDDYRSAARMGEVIRTTFDALAAGEPAANIIKRLRGGLA